MCGLIKKKWHYKTLSRIRESNYITILYYIFEIQFEIISWDKTLKL